jgi:hypothetical protein
MKDQQTFIADILSRTIVFSSVHFIVASMELPPKINVSTYQITQQRIDATAKSLGTYMMFSLIWVSIVCFIMYISYKRHGIIVSLIVNAIIIYWIVSSYMRIIKKNVENNGLIYPTYF